ncbi:hypothetical protein SBV42_03595 [Chlamydia crocodili]|uniref:Uncharacterized protein n=1 Tax=Chlamydia crocodili TaxID=2766982 RepID=A0ABX8CD58_9CHLA|nr:hypothetical protein [Chlamydia crocodili]QVE48847.1 hypothetical protein H9Q19_03965 [Chlamydia crocodili]
MCCPIGCGCKFTVQEGHHSGQQENQPLQNPITTQPGGKASLEIKLGDGNDILDKIKCAGQIVSSVLNAASTQRGAGYCREHCGPWCDSHCPNWLSHCFQCLCTCIINPSDSQRANQDLSKFLSDMKDKHGTIVLGMGMQHNGIDFPYLMSEGKTLNQDQKNNFDKQCSEIKENLKKLLMGGLQKELFDTANDSKKLPKINENDTIMTKRGYGDVMSGIHHTPPSIWILYDNDENSKDDSKGAAGGSQIHYTKQLDWTKLRHQLNHLSVVQLDSGEKFPLGGKEGKKAIEVLRNTLYWLTQGASCFEKGETGYGLTITSDKLLKLILLSLLSLGYCPTDKKGKVPGITYADLERISKFLRENRNHNEHLFGPGDPNDPYDDTEVDGQHQSSGSSSSTDTGNNQDDDDWFSNKHQDDLLKLSGGVNSLAGILG